MKSSSSRQKQKQQEQQQQQQAVASPQDNSGTGSNGTNSARPPADADCQFSVSQLKKLKDAFDFFDIDNDGRISSGELRKVLKFLGTRVTEEEAKRMIADVDIDRNGTVELDEFIRMMAAYHRRQQRASDSDDDDNDDNQQPQGSQPSASSLASSAEEAEALEAFRAFDHNGDNYIDSGELKKTMHFLGEQITDEEVQCMIREADVNRDGRIDFEEFKRMMSAMKRGP